MKYNFITTKDYLDLEITHQISPEQFENTLNEILFKVYQDGFDTGLRESVKAISKLTPNNL